MNHLNYTLLGLSIALLSACSGANLKEIDTFVAEANEVNAGAIDPIPAFRPYENFTYGATAQRAPFTKPVKVQEITRIQSVRSNVKPNLNRSKEYLERFNLESLNMVGTMEQSGQLWVLIDDSEGGVHRVRKGNYLGRNHGRIVDATAGYISVMEIVSDGTDSGWIERPRTLKLDENDG